VIKFVSDLWQVGGFLQVLLVSFSNKTDCHDITEILLKVALKHHNPIQTGFTVPLNYYIICNNLFNNYTTIKNKVKRPLILFQLQNWGNYYVLYIINIIYRIQIFYFQSRGPWGVKWAITSTLHKEEKCCWLAIRDTYTQYKQKYYNNNKQ
jgi:hypothetical protein